jgi:UPF0755 protein
MQEDQNTFQIKNWREKISACFSDKQNQKKVGSFLVAFILSFSVSWIIQPPEKFPQNSIVNIHDGESLDQIALNLKNIGAIKSSFIFRNTVILLGGEKNITADDYLLKSPENVLVLAWRFAHDKTYVNLVKITVPEGWSVREISDYLKNKIPKIDTGKFQKMAMIDEGYLFPDTYFISPTITPESLIGKMKNNFTQKISAVAGIKQSGKSLSDIVTMASILEDEAKTTEDRKIVAGILWKRLSLGMPLQVDSTIAYATTKSLSDLTATDLKIKSPYNTYLYKGLPPTPIGNPGLDAILAAVTPTQTQYLYYISDKNGVMHYAVTFAEHQKNVAKYLK